MVEDELITEYIYGEQYTFIVPYSVSLEDTMKAMGHIIDRDSSYMSVEAKSFTYGTADGFTCSFLSDQKNGVTGTGKDLLSACYNALYKFVKNETEKKNKDDKGESKGDVEQGET